MTEEGWQRADRWYELFDMLCDRAGYYDDADLAAAYCALTGHGERKQFEAAARNLNNWRSGRHLPRPGNLRLLARLLKVADDPELQQHWTRLYRQAGQAPESSSRLPVVSAGLGRDVELLPPAAVGTDVLVPYRAVAGGGRRWSSAQAALACLVFLCAGAAAGATVATYVWQPWRGVADDAPVVPFRPKIEMKLGETRVIHAERGDCGKLPRDWAAVQSNLPYVRMGSFSDGGLARRFSKFCQGLTPARAIRFTATSAGIEEFEIQGDFFKLTVLE